MTKREEFLPISYQDMLIKGWQQPDFIIVSGDAYVDHPSFGTAIISRTLERYGFKVCLLAQPNWKDANAFKIFGKPRLGFMVTAGNIDSMVNHYSVAKKRRKKDFYSPNGKMGLRPDRATIVYSNTIRQAYKDVPIILGGIEASLRRMAHYDYWDDKVRRSILLDAQADLLIYGMAEKTVVEVAEALDAGLDIKDLVYIKGTVFKTKDINQLFDSTFLPSYQAICDDPFAYIDSFNIQEKNTDPLTAIQLVESYDKDRIFVVQTPPNDKLTQLEMDDTYALPYTREYHPIYKKLGHIPAIDEVKYSLISNRGCFGGCNFCALTFHQGRTIQSRSKDSLVEEARKITEDPDFKGYIHDVGGPTANFYAPSCEKQKKYGICSNKQCLVPNPCDNLIVDHSKYLEILKSIRELPNVKKVFVRSGLRYDYLMYDKDDRFFRELVQHHISGQLKVAPEHINDTVLDYMGKPRKGLYDRFVIKYNTLNKQYNKNQFLVPYLMSSHPGSGLKEAIELAEYLRDTGQYPEQVQDFYPTPGTASTTMYYTGIDPRTKKKVYVCKDPEEKAMQRALMQYRNPKNYRLVHKALTKAGRTDLIGYKKSCLIPKTPYKPTTKNNDRNKKQRKL